MVPIAYVSPDLLGSAMISDFTWLEGREYDFPDGVKLRIIQIKNRDTGPWVTYEHVYAGSTPRRFTQKIGEFIDTHGHLFPKD